MVIHIFYNAFKRAVALFFNLLNMLLRGNLPPLGTVCVVVEKDGRYLVVERPEGAFVFPGGFMLWREHSEQTARREAKEETGLDLRVGAIIGCYTTPSVNIDAMSTVTIVHVAEVIGGELRSSIEGQPRWIDKETVPHILSKHYQPILTKYLKQDKQPDTANVG